jgi:hypothetical protein
MKRSLIFGLFTVAIAIACAVATVGFGQEKGAKSRVAEVESFHELLKQVWHEHYPAKEWAKIRSMRGDLVARKDAVMEVRLRIKPGDQARVEEARKKFGASVNSFAEVAGTGSDSGLGDSVIKMHEAFEVLNDLIR